MRNIPYRRNRLTQSDDLALCFNVKRIVEEEKEIALQPVYNLPERNLTNGLIDDVVTILFHSCAYAILEYEHDTARDAIIRACNEVHSDTIVMLDDLQLCDLEAGAYLEWISHSGKTYDDTSYFMEFVDVEQFVIMNTFINSAVTRIYHELFYPAFCGQVREVINVEYLAQPDYHYKVVVRAEYA